LKSYLREKINVEFRPRASDAVIWEGYQPTGVTLTLS
jgi:hypothetical protein